MKQKDRQADSVHKFIYWNLCTILINAGSLPSLHILIPNKIVCEMGHIKFQDGDLCLFHLKQLGNDTGR